MNLGSFLRRMGQDLRDTLEDIRRHTAQDGSGRDLSVEVTGDGPATQVPQHQPSKLDAILQQLQNNTAAVHLLHEGYMQLNYKCERGQRDAGLTLKFIKTVMDKIRSETYDTPRLACLLSPWTFSLPQGLSPEEQDPKIWTRRLLDGGASKTGGWFRENMQLFLVCACTYRLVPCGPEGHGYKIRQFRTWMKSTVDIMRVMVELTSIVLGASVASDLSSYLLNAAEGSLGIVGGDDVSSLKTYLRGSTSGMPAVIERVRMS